VLNGHTRRALRIPVSSAQQQRLSDAILAARQVAGAFEFRGHAASDGLCERNPELPRPPPQPTVLGLIELYLSTHQDGMTIPS